MMETQLSKMRFCVSLATREVARLFNAHRIRTVDGGGHLERRELVLPNPRRSI